MLVHRWPFRGLKHNNEFVNRDENENPNKKIENKLKRKEEIPNKNSTFNVCEFPKALLLSRDTWRHWHPYHKTVVTVNYTWIHHHTEKSIAHIPMVCCISNILEVKIGELQKSLCSKVVKIAHSIQSMTLQFFLPFKCVHLASLAILSLVYFCIHCSHLAKIGNEQSTEGIVLRMKAPGKKSSRKRMVHA